MANQSEKGAVVATWMASVRFPDGRMRYATYCGIVYAVLDDLYSRFLTVGETNRKGLVIRKAAVAGMPEPRFPAMPLSDVDEMIPVRISVEPDGENWAALFCPLQNQLIGPMNALVVDDMQHCLALISQRGRLHLYLPGTAQTFCGQDVTGKELPFRDLRPSGQTGPEAVQPRRDLFAEWEGGKVCRHCLMNALTAHWHWSSQALAYQGDGAA